MSEATEFEPDNGAFDPATETSDDVTERNPDVPEVSEAEQKARKRGWLPQDEYLAQPDADPDLWVDYEDFNTIGLQHRQLSKQSKLIDELRQGFSGIKEEHFRIQREAFERGKAEAQKALSEAVEAGDTKGAQQAADHLASLQAPVSQPQQGRDWKSEFASANPWFGKHEVATRLATQMDSELAVEIPNPEVRLQIVAERVRSMTDVGKAPSNPNRDRAPDTGGTRRASGKPQYSEKDLTPSQRQTLKQLNAVLPRNEQMTAHEYRTQLEEAFGNG